jgi:hypothetical protein
MARAPDEPYDITERSLDGKQRRSMRNILGSGRRKLVQIGLVAVVVALGAAAAARAQPGPSKPPAAHASAAAAAAVTVGKPNDLVVSYLGAWSERDAKRRHELIAATWTDGGTYVDASRHGEGHDGIDAMIKAVHDKFPPAYAFRLISGIEAHHGYVRFTWAAGGTPNAPLYFEGTDIFVLAPDGRVQQVIGFKNAAPAPAAH